MNIKKALILLALLLSVLILSFSLKKVNFYNTYKVGQKIDSLNGVYIYYNGGFSNVVQRNVKDGYNLGLQYQCVEFVKRYYYEHYSHKMPNSYGHAKDFFKSKIVDGDLNKERNLIQFSNPSKTLPQVGDILVMNKTKFNPFGHVAIVSQVSNFKIWIIQQNCPSTRISFNYIKNNDGYYEIKDNEVLGWLRIKR